LGKMEDVGKEGRTVIFVSHNMGAMSSLCTRGILLNQGACIGDDEIGQIISKYMVSNSVSTGEVISLKEPNKNQKLKIRGMRILDSSESTTSEVDSRKDAFVEISFEILVPGQGYAIVFEVQSVQHGSIFTSTSWDENPLELRTTKLERGEYSARIKLPMHLIRGGEYIIKATSAIPAVEVLDILDEELIFKVVDLDSPVAQSGEGRTGCILPVLPWEIHRNS
jgi:lipopolysaccharide transport system ATP-binding protein